MNPSDTPGAPELPRGVKAPAAHAEDDQTPVELGPAAAGHTPQLVNYHPRQLTRPAEEEDEDDLNEHVESPGDPDGLIAAEEERKWKELHAKPAAAAAPALVRKKRHWPWVLLVFILIGGAAYGAYWFGGRQADKDNPKPASAQSTAKTTADKPADKAPASVPTKHYDSTTYTLGFDYPQTWALSDTTAKLTITSPTVSLTTTGSTVNGHVVVTFQNKQTAIAGYPAGGALAALESDKLTYKQPTSIQRAQTYLSYLGFGSASALDAIYITGDNGYQAGQNIPQADVLRGDPLVSVTFQSCTSNDCSSGTPAMLTLQAAKWHGSSLDTQVNDLLKSLQLD